MAEFACGTHTQFGTPLAPSGGTSMRYPHPFGHAPHALRCSQGAPPEVPVAELACGTHIHFGTPLIHFAAP
eukprot:5143276-Pyramimonas_sp.AAC.1